MSSLNHMYEPFVQWFCESAATFRENGPMDTIWFRDWTTDVYMRQSPFCRMSERGAEAASQARKRRNYYVTTRTKVSSNHKFLCGSDARECPCERDRTADSRPRDQARRADRHH